MRPLLFVLLFFTSYFSLAQVTDNDIVKSIIGKHFYEINSKLDSLGVWYCPHYPENISELQKVFSIADRKGSVKLFTLSLFETIIDEITINYRHDSREQCEDFLKITGQTSFHVGKYSSDMVFKRKKMK
ncbi:MAG: hypothetical protein Q8O72_05525 [Bacteroidales bacterium]|nr:hypothetical protein [Bacteroidales bacterium]